MRAEAFAVGLMLLGVVFASAAEIVLAVSLLVAGGTYALILPQFIDRERPVPQ